MTKILFVVSALTLTNVAFASLPASRSSMTEGQRKVAEALAVLKNANLLVPTEAGLLVQLPADGPRFEMLDVGTFDQERSALALPRTEVC
jgi:hypothetical protein